MPRIRFVAGSQRDSSAPGASTARLINLYSEDVPESETSAILRACYGMDLMQSLDGVFIRDLQEVGGFLYAVLSSGWYRVDEAGSVLLQAATGGTQSGVSRNFNAVTACVGGELYALDLITSAVTNPATGLAAGVAWVEFLAGRTICGEIGTGKFAWSDVADPGTFPGLNFAVAEAREDETLRGIVVGNNLYLFGRKTTEVWAPSGTTGETAFQPLGVVLDRGLRGYELACVADGAVFMVGDDGIAYLASGDQIRPISTPAVNSAIRDGQPESCTFWEERGHKFCAITFFDRPAWVFDISTGRWWERGEGTDRAPWRGRVCAKLGDTWVTGANDGGVYALRDILTDAGGVHYREATSGTIDTGQWFTVAELEILTGAGFETGNVMLATGDGVSFGQPRSLPLPAVGYFTGRTNFRALGRHRKFAARVSMTDSADVPLYADAMVRLA